MKPLSFHTNRSWAIAHRGASAYLPENTIPAFALAFSKFKSDMIEFDVRISRDNIPVVIHDSRLERTTDGKGRVCDYTLKELQHFDAGYCFDPADLKTFPQRNKGFYIPSLEEIFQKFPGRDFAIEIKDPSTELTLQVIRLVKKYDILPRCILGSLHDRVWWHLLRAMPEARVFTSKGKIFRMLAEYRLIPFRPRKRPLWVASMPVSYPWFDLKAKAWIDWLKEREISVFFWTVNTTGLAKTLFERGAHGIMSDDPALLNRVLNRDDGIAPTNV